MMRSSPPASRGRIITWDDAHLVSSFDKPSRSVTYHLYTLWLFNRSDIKTIILPQTTFAISATLAGPTVSAALGPSTGLGQLLTRVNKPWRPLPSQRLSISEAFWLRIIWVPVACIIAYPLGGLLPSLWMVCASMLHDDSGLLNRYTMAKNFCNSIGITCFSFGATIVLGGLSASELTARAWTWIAITAAIVLTTVHVQDLADVVGDRACGRLTVPIVWGEAAARLTAAAGVVMWSLLCPWFWQIRSYAVYGAVMTGALAICIAMLPQRSERADKIAWKLWCGWMAILYLLPAISIVSS
ncbi:UbiA prenyltransferase family-domain-containing protein [Auriculariales sp. MPI-PUGE-AT-0066]|nr:UbiA prenyltransferase family-domain-containing protein [Auriculariales sp. MPI-PUGE-AT-0066]